MTPAPSNAATAAATATADAAPATTTGRRLAPPGGEPAADPEPHPQAERHSGGDRPTSAKPATAPGELARRWSRFVRALSDAVGHLLGRRRADLLAELSAQAPGNATLDQSAKDLMTNILNVGDASVEDVVISRADMIAVATDTSLEDVLDKAVCHGHSRFPVFDGTLDHIVGVVNVKDALKARQGNGPTRAADLAREAIFVAPSMPIIQMLAQMRETRQHMAFVVDEFGGIDGLITIEDLIEQIVGNIEDEHDAAAPSIERLDDDRAVADAGISLEDADAVLGAFLEDEERSDEVDTLGGLIFTSAGRIPLRGEQIAHDSGLKFLILDATPRRIRRVEISGLRRGAPVRDGDSSDTPDAAPVRS